MAASASRSYNNATTINCNGHTIIATNGGIFALLAKGTQGSVIENCYLKGFTTAIEATGGSGRIYNNTILQTTPDAHRDHWSDYFQGGSINQNNVTGGDIAFAAYNIDPVQPAEQLGVHVKDRVLRLQRDRDADDQGLRRPKHLLRDDPERHEHRHGKGADPQFRTAGLRCLGGSQKNTGLISDQGGKAAARSRTAPG